jgi:hypothetical protein
MPMRREAVTLIVLSAFLVFACTPTITPPTPPPPSSTPSPPTATATVEPPVPTPTPEANGDPRPEAEIAILTPGPGSRVVSPVRVAGIADPTFEQTLVVRIVSADGDEMALMPTMIGAMLGERGPYEVDVEFVVAEDTQAFIQVYDLSARDGGTVALESVGVTLIAEGPDEIVTVAPYLQQVAILSPSIGDTVSGGLAQVTAFGWASFEQTLVIEVQDEDGDVVGMIPVTLTGDFGEAVPFTAEVPYTVDSSGPGRIAIRDISPAFGGDSFVTSVEITLAP